MCWGGGICLCVSFPSRQDPASPQPQDNEVHTVRKVCVGLKSKTQCGSEANMVEWCLHHASNPGSNSCLTIASQLSKYIGLMWPDWSQIQRKAGFLGEEGGVCVRMLFLMIMQSSALQKHVWNKTLDQHKITKSVLNMSEIWLECSDSLIMFISR